MLGFVEAPSVVILALAGLVTATGSLISTVMGARRARDEERQQCEEKLRSIRLEAGSLAEELYTIKTQRRTP